MVKDISLPNSKNHCQYFYVVLLLFGASLVAQMMKNPPTMWETWCDP